MCIYTYIYKTLATLKEEAGSELGVYLKLFEVPHLVELRDGLKEEGFTAI